MSNCAKKRVGGFEREIFVFCVVVGACFMAVEFILGRSGSGKTSMCIGSICDALAESAEGGSLVLLVPEQATYQAERSILSDERIGGYSRLHVLSFERLAFYLSPSGFGASEISRIAQEMVVHKVLRDVADGLRVYGDVAALPGLATELRRVIVELHEYEKEPGDVIELAKGIASEGMGDSVADKFFDIGVVYQGYLDFLAAKGDVFVNPDSGLTAVRQMVRGADFLRGATLWVDGFSGFTIQQRELLKEMLSVVGQAHIALCLDPGGIDINNPDAQLIDPADMFHETLRTYADLFEVVKRSKLELVGPVVLGEGLRFSGAEALGHIERELFSVDGGERVPAGDAVRVVSAANCRAEVSFVCREVLRLVRDEGYRYRDIAVIASDLSGYQHYVEAAFGEYEVPFFIDRPRSLSTHPVVELIASAMQAVVGGFSTSDVLGYLKSGVGPLCSDEVDLLENYCAAFGINGGDWISERGWAFAEKGERDFDEGVIDDIRRRAVGPLVKLRDDLAGDFIKPEQFTAAIWGMLEVLDVGGKLSEWGDDDAGEVVDHRQFFDKLVDVFDEFNEIFAGDEMVVADFAAILGQAFSGMTLKLIPSKLDQVLAGSIERSRHPDLKAVFLLGTTQKQFPIPVSFDAILTEDDREIAESQEFVLADKLSVRLAGRQYLAYIAFTRPGKRLYITYPAMDAEGKTLVRSGFVDNVMSLFSDLEEENYLTGESDVACAYNLHELKGILCERLGPDWRGGDGQEELLTDLCQCLCEDVDELIADAGQSVRRALGYDNSAVLDPAVAGNLVGDTLLCSVTRLGGFAGCPYQHYAKYMLNLKVRKTFKFQPMDLGTFYHRVLDEMYRKLNKQGEDFATVSAEQLRDLCRERISEITSSDAFLVNFMQRSAHNVYIIDSAAGAVEECVVAIGEMSKAGAFRQRASELAFGMGDGVESHCEYVLDGGRKVIVRGCIDRVDIAEVDGKRVAVVFDYKRRGKNLSWSKLYHGLDMQLGIYLLAMENTLIDGKKVDAVGGAFFVPIEVPPVSVSISLIDKEIAKFSYKAKGVLDGRYSGLLDSQLAKGRSRFYNFAIDKEGQPYSYFGSSDALKGEQFEWLLGEVKERIVGFGERIFAGEIGIRPYRMAKQSPCAFCDYNSLCRFDWQINEYNPLESLSKKQVLDRQGGGDE